jgi:hypothetical protein
MLTTGDLDSLLTNGDHSLSYWTTLAASNYQHNYHKKVPECLLTAKEELLVLPMNVRYSYRSPIS